MLSLYRVPRFGSYWTAATSGSRFSKVVRLITACCVGPACALPPGPASITIWVGDTAPAPTALLSRSKPCTDCGLRGIPSAEPGVSASQIAGTARTTSTMAPRAKNAAGLAMIARASRAQKPWSTSTVPGSFGRGTWSRSRTNAAAGQRAVPRRPNTESSAGCSVTAAIIETMGIRKPPTPIERMNGSGMKSNTASPIATAAPEKTTARPAVSIVRTIASSLDSPRASSSRKR